MKYFVYLLQDLLKRCIIIDIDNNEMWKGNKKIATAFFDDYFQMMSMDYNEIVSKINTYLREAAIALSEWLNDILPKVADSWWQDCVISSLSYIQNEVAIERKFTKLSEFDLAALLKIANKSWYDMRTVVYLSSHEREVIREMVNVRNNWAHCSAELPGKDTIIQDLRTIQEFFSQLGKEDDGCEAINDIISNIENSDNMTGISVTTPTQYVLVCEATPTEIVEKSIVYIVGSPEIKGVVFSISDIGSTRKYEVFANGSMRTFYSGQIALYTETTAISWINSTTFSGLLTAYQINNPSSQNLYSLNSARIDFVPYQFRPALKLIHSDEPRILIADSVGVGKTIEAGLIIKELEARNELEKIMIICPRPLVAERKWELEMKRFDEEFIALDGMTLRQIISDTDRDGEWPTRYNRVIVPYSILDGRIYNGESQKRNRSFGLSELDPAPHFDVVIVDEAHHIRNGSMDKEKAFAYKCTKYFCDHSDAVVMLTATPLQTSDDDLFTILNVLRPDIVIDEKTFEVMSRPNEYISKASHIIRHEGENWTENAKQELLSVRKTQWGDSVISENPLYDNILSRLEKKDISHDERVKLIFDVESLHSFNTMLNRTRRRDIQDFCVRRSYTISTEFTNQQQELHDELLSFEKEALSVLHDARSVPFMMSTVKRQAASCIFGIAPYIRDMVSRRLQQMNDDSDIDIARCDIDTTTINSFSSLTKNLLALADNLPDEDPKFEKTFEIIMQKQEHSNNKIMLFSTYRHTLSYLKNKLSEHGLRVEQIDGSIKDEQRYEIKERFALSREDENALDIILFTEVGSEGLDYQFCDTMINYDLPWNPMRIEQRIGRIDRRGQRSEAVSIYNIITENTVDADIYYRCLMRIGVFENSIGECEEILGEIANEIESIAVNAALTEDERRDKLLQMSDNEIRKVQELNRLEDEEKELFGFDLSEFTSAQEIRKAESPWLTPSGLQKMIELYFSSRISNGTFILGNGAVKNLRLPATARNILKNDCRKLSGGQNAVRRAWENYLCGKLPNHSVTTTTSSGGLILAL